jgi:hypothetical protein
MRNEVIETGVSKDMGDHRGGRGLAVGTRDHDRNAIAQKLIR